MPGPRGRHGWRGARGLHRGQVARLLEPCLLLLLQEQERHGYELIAALDRFGLDPALVDSGLIYRMLRQMEQAGWVASAWHTTGPGPARRVYRLTEAGHEALAAWREELGRTHDIIHRVLG